MRSIHLKQTNDVVDFFNVDDFPFDKINFTETIEKGRRCYCVPFGTFDIETTSITKKRFPILKRNYGFMYIWQACVDGICVHGRTWASYQVFIDKLHEHIPYGAKLVIYIHSLSFEFQFMRNFFKFDDVFAKKKRLVVKASSGKIEYRCSYMLSNMGLNKFTQKTANVVHKKMDGEEFDYTVLRFADTELTNDEYGYCICDVLGLWECIKELLKEDTLLTIPITSTGYVRRDYRNVCLESKEHKKRFYNLRLDEDSYVLCKEASRGAISGSNNLHTNELLEYLQSFDIKSSYPYQMMTKYFPASKFMRYTPKYKSTMFEYLLDNKCCLIEWSCSNLKVKRGCGIPYISKAKCRAISGHITGNGKVYSAKRIGMCCTEIDFRIIQTHYTFDEDSVSIMQIHACDRGMLSKPFREHLAYMFQQKTDLDGVDKFLYDKYKNKINSSYGMMLTDIVNTEIVYNPYTEDIKNVWTKDESISLTDSLKKYYNNYNSFLSYQDGVWVLAHARDDLVKGMDIMGNDLVQSDTDSVKGLSDLTDYRPLFDRLNKSIIDKAEDYDVKPYAIGRDGSKVYLGIWEYECKTGKNYSYRYFKSLGAKKYCYDCDDGEGMQITVAGLNKSAAKYIESHGGFDSFTPGFHIPSNKSGRTASTYNDEVCKSNWTFMGHKIEYASNIAVENVGYTFGVTSEWLDMIMRGTVPPDQTIDDDNAWWGDVDIEDIEVSG